MADAEQRLSSGLAKLHFAGGADVVLEGPCRFTPKAGGKLFLAEGRLTVRLGKNRRSREIPLHPSTVQALERYARARDQLVAALGLDRSMWLQYFHWIGGILLHGDFGRSLWQNTLVSELLGARLPITFQLGFMALIVALTIALPIGVYSAIRQDTAGDYLTRSFSILMLAVPSFWMGTMVMVFPSIWWGWSPEVKFIPFRQDPLHNLSQMILPAIRFKTSSRWRCRR